MQILTKEGIIGFEEALGTPNVNFMIFGTTFILHFLHLFQVQSFTLIH